MLSNALLPIVLGSGFFTASPLVYSEEARIIFSNKSVTESFPAVAKPDVPDMDEEARTQAPMTLEKMMLLVGQRDPRILVNEMSARAAHEHAAKERAAHYPQISGNYVRGYESSDSTQTSSLGPVSSHTSDHFKGGQINLNWEIFAWGATQKRYLEAYALAKAEEDKYQRAWDLIVLEAVENYVNMYRLRNQLEITRQTLLGHAKLLKVVEDRVNAKLIPASRKSEALLRMQEIMADREDILSQLNEINTTFTTLTGLPSPGTLAAPIISPTYTTKLAKISTNDNIKLSYSIHPQILANLETIQAADHAIASIRADRLPKLNFYARYNDNRLFAAQGSTFPYSGRGYELGLNLTWTLFGGAYGNGIAERIYLKEKSEADNERALREIDRNIHISRDALEVAKNRQMILEETLRLSEEVLKQKQQLFGTQAMSDDAVNGLSGAYYARARAATGLLNLHMREIIASYTLLESSGLIFKEFPLPLSPRGEILPARVAQFVPSATATMNPRNEPNMLPERIRGAYVDSEILSTERIEKKSDVGTRLNNAKATSEEFEDFLKNENKDDVFKKNRSSELMKSNNFQLGRPAISELKDN